MTTLLLGLCAWFLISCLTGPIVGRYLHEASDEAQDPLVVAERCTCIRKLPPIACFAFCERRPDDVASGNGNPAVTAGGPRRKLNPTVSIGHLAVGFLSSSIVANASISICSSMPSIMEQDACEIVAAQPETIAASQ